MDLQEKIAAARREADGLKEQIRSRKDKMADTSCEYAYECRERDRGGSDMDG